MHQHSNMVKIITSNIAKKILTPEIYNRYEKILTHISLLHDIGKITKSFQSILKNKNNKDIKYSHNEIGWAFLSKYYTGKYKEILLYSVFWHHGIYNKLNNITDDIVINSISDDDINNMIEYFKNSIGEEYFIDGDIYNYDTVNAPLYHQHLNNSISHWKIIYGCIVSGDRIASSNNQNLDFYFNLTKIYNPILNWEYKNTNRSKEQISIVEKCNGTTQLNAPAGFGKTIIGLLWGLKRTKKIIWVCPRNTIAESVYINVLRELKTMNISPSVELILGGEIKSGGNGNLFESDIIITNIDNFLAPSNNNSLLKYYSLINGGNVIFDEYHELISNSALFSAFINIMKGRNLLTTSETLLLSATPNLINYKWEGNTFSKKPTQILPGPNKHFNAQHNNVYDLTTYNESCISNINIPKSNTLVILNSIIKAQNEKKNRNYSDLFHSKYINSERERKLNTLLTNHGKNGNSSNNIVGTHILQASLDISFNNVFESCMSPDSTLQRFGRNNRWGYEKNANFTSILLDNNNENLVCNILYDIKLRQIWFDSLKSQTKKLTLNDLYHLYNEFFINNSKLIKYNINKLYNDSNKKLEFIYPIKYKNKVKTNIISSNGNKLRSNGKDIFYIVKKINGGWSDVFSEEVLSDYDKHFKEDKNTLLKMIKIMKEFKSNLDIRFDYSDILNKHKHKRGGITLDNIRRYAKKSNTPYIRFDKVYDDELGIIINK